ncbi:uncharacterized protein QC761_0018050 [Podospora bellae-mahoneyi]|uniref:Uncharacterized protein n=1 Tax=Podospora bellae-mahoneyi TaxID=2093777 RepID=A0ABR0G072_9PEZI|nr:hypothetical protein QC761_0018050 [Podospora bellae-mahoneyi]
MNRNTSPQSAAFTTEISFSRHISAETSDRPIRLRKEAERELEANHSRQILLPAGPAPRIVSTSTAAMHHGLIARRMP